MKELSDSKIYEQNLQYWPYKESLKKVIKIICSQTPNNGTLLDLMCGPGYLLGQIGLKRKDLKLKGVDLDKKYITYANKEHPQINFEKGDALSWEPKKQFDVIICTGSLHHIPYAKQPNVVKRMASMVNPEGFCLISDCYIDDYSNEKQRKIAAAKLGYEYLKETIKNGAPNEVIQATIDILNNDVMMEEFKTSINKRLLIYKKYFDNVKTIKTWPKHKSEYGDYISICRKNN